MLWLLLTLASLSIWLAIAAIGAWRTREVFDAEMPEATGEVVSLDDVTVLIPARNEAETLPFCLRALAAQGEGLRIIVIDDQSSDLTFKFARNALAGRAQVIAGTPPPQGWTGKLWALEQGRREVTTRWVLLLDADIELQPGIVAALLAKARRDSLHFISLMAALRMESFWEKLLLPAFVYFFKLLYSFRWANDARHTKVAAAAGGCILVEARVLEQIGGFAALRGALIDDCALAGRVKAQGFRTWIGLTHAARSMRGYQSLRPVWDMVARSAFTQLHYSATLLIAVTALLAVAYIVPPLALLAAPSIGTPPGAAWLALAALVAMLVTYLPVLRYYRRSPWWALFMPLIALMYLAMTWSSAYRYWRGQRSAWSGRSYSKTLDSTTY